MIQSSVIFTLTFHKHFVIYEVRGGNYMESLISTAESQNPQTSDSPYSANDTQSQYTLQIKLRSSVVEEFFDVPRMKIHRWEEAGKIQAGHEEHGSRKIRYFDAENVRKMVDLLGRKQNVDGTYTYAIWHNKGGVGKSTVVFQLATMMSTLMGLKVLVIDTDGQADTTHLFNAEQEVPLDTDDFIDQRSICDILYDLMDPHNHTEESLKESFEDTKKTILPGLDLIPSDDRVVELDYDIRELKGKGIITEEKGDESFDLSSVALLKKFISFVQETYDYDVILIDCSPDLGDMNVNVLFAADCLLIPVELEPKAPHSLKRVYNRLIKLAKMHESFSFEKLLIVPNMNERHDVKAVVQTRIRDMLPNFSSRITLTKTTTVVKAIGQRLPIFNYQDPNAKWMAKIPEPAKRLTNELWDLCHEMLNLEEPKPDHHGLFKPKGITNAQ